MDHSRKAAEEAQFFDLAHEGAHIRAISTSLADDPLGVRDLRPRSIVVLVSSERARRAAELAIGLHEPLPLPVVITHKLPDYIGPLDVLCAAGPQLEEENLQAISIAAQRGCPTMVVGCGQDIAEDDLPSAVLLAELPAGGAHPEKISLSRVTIAVHQLISFASGRQAGGHGAENYAELADAVDLELESCAPNRDEVLNPARQLAAAASGHRVLHTFEPRRPLVPRAVARCVAAEWAAQGMSCGLVEAAELSEVLVAQAQSSGGGELNDIFYDPLIDGPTAVLPLRVVVWSSRLADADAEALHIPAGGRIEMPSEVHEQTLSPLATALTLVVRAVAAAIYDGEEAEEK